LSNNGTIDVGGMPISPEQAQAAMDSMRAVNLDEVMIEVITVKVRHYKEEAIVDDEGNPLLDGHGSPLMYRVPKTRTARIQSLVPVDIYHKAMALQNQNTSASGMINAMTDVVLEIWQITEPWMDRKTLVEGVDFEGIAALAERFFDKLNHPSGNKA
jgi:hypothetical protein